MPNKDIFSKEEIEELVDLQCADKISQIKNELNRIESRTMKRFKDSVNKCDISAIAESSGDLVHDITTTDSLLLELGKLEKVTSAETEDLINRVLALTEKHYEIVSNLEDKCMCTPK